MFYRRHLYHLVLLAPLLVINTVFAEVNDARARYHYQMFCQGCHTPDGSGANAVPALKDRMGLFLTSQRGREFLVRVPGSATSKLTSAELAEVLNWCLLNFAGTSLPSSGYEPYTEEEVDRLRQDPLQEIIQHRASVITEIAAQSSQGTQHE